MNRAIVILLLLLSISIESRGEDRFSEIEITSHTITTKGTVVDIAMTISTSSLRLRANESLILTPQIINNNNTINLPEIVLDGRNGKIVEYRERSSKNSDSQIRVRAGRNRDEHIDYNTSIRYRNWLNNAALAISSMVVKCNTVRSSPDRIDILEQIIPSYNFSPYLSYITDKKREVKCDSITSEIMFADGAKVINPIYQNNSSAIIKINSLTRDKKITKIMICGSASPRGEYLSNITLSKDRAYALANFVANQTGISIDSDHIWWVGENWDRMKSEIEHSNMREKITALNILNDYTNPKERKLVLTKLNGGSTMRYIEEELYPQLRYAKCTIYFSSGKEIDIDKLISRYRSNPYTLSLSEILAIASHYKESGNQQKYANIITRGAKLYNNCTALKVNLSSIMIDNGDITGAYNTLYSLRKDPLTWNNLAVVYTKMGNISKAKKYFEMSSNDGNIDSKRNIKQLITYINNQGSKQ